jgi:hypothetical protein
VSVNILCGARHASIYLGWLWDGFFTAPSANPHRARACEEGHTFQAHVLNTVLLGATERIAMRKIATALIVMLVLVGTGLAVTVHPHPAYACEGNNCK